jgi:GNAT superfamily N-acetyltransferase
MNTSILDSADDWWAWRPENPHERYGRDGNDNRVYTMRMDICTSRTSVVCAAWNCPVEGSPDAALSGIPGGLVLPCAVLMRVQVPEPLRGRGHGKAALKMFESIAIEHGCPMAFMIVDGDELKELDKNRQIYESQGWHCCDNYDPPYHTYMYKRLPTADSRMVINSNDSHTILKGGAL